MSTQNSEMFNQVRDILKKLDRSIDDAREKRLAADADDGQQTENDFQNARPGRARPLRRDGDNGFSASPRFS